MPPEDKVAPEVALAEFEKLCHARRIDIDESEMDSDDLEKFKDLRSKITRKIRAGRFAVEDDGSATFRTVDGKTITFHPARGADLMAIDEHPEGKDMAKMAGMFQSMTRSSKGAFAALDLSDANFCASVLSLFLQAG